MIRMRVRPRDVRPGDLVTRYPIVNGRIDIPVQMAVTKVNKFKDATRGGAVRYQIYTELPEGTNPNHFSNRYVVSAQSWVYVDRDEES